MTSAIKIGPEFFANSIRDYSDKHWAFVREILQNAMDSDGCNRINITVQNDGEGTIVTVQDNGAGMTREILVEKLLALGGSGKACERGKVGGFGKAKELLYLAQRHYQIDTLEHRVVGSGANYDLTEIARVPGCTAKVWWNGSDDTRMLETFRRFLSMCLWRGEVVLNGVQIRTILNKGTHRRSFEFAHVYSNKTYAGLMIVRMGGIPMFVQGVDYKGTLVIELIGSSYAVLTANRDSLLYQYSTQLQGFVRDLTVNKSKALNVRSTKILKFDGPAISVDFRQMMVAAATAGGTVAVAVATDEEQGLMIPAEAVLGQQPQASGISAAPTSIARMGAFNFKFTIKNTTGMDTPDYYKPGAQFSSYAKRLVSWWVNCLTEIHRTLNVNATFGVGFILDEDAEAQHEVRDGETTYYINPAMVVRQQKSASRSLKRRFDLTTDQMRVLADAVHEFTHRDHSGHSEDFASAITSHMGKVMKALPSFEPCFRKSLIV